MCVYYNGLSIQTVQRQLESSAIHGELGKPGVTKEACFSNKNIIQRYSILHLSPQPTFQTFYPNLAIAMAMASGVMRELVVLSIRGAGFPQNIKWESNPSFGTKSLLYILCRNPHNVQPHLQLVTLRGWALGTKPRLLE